MKKTLEFVLYLFYKYYDKGSTKVIAYQSALIAASVLLFMNIMAILIALDIDINKVFPVIETHGRLIKFISSALLWLPFYLIFRYAFNEENLLKLEVSKRKQSVGGLLLIFYILLSIVLLVFVIKLKA